MVNVDDLSGGEIYLSEFVLNKSSAEEIYNIREDIKNISWNELKFIKSRNNITIRLPEYITKKIKEYNKSKTSFNEVKYEFSMSIDDSLSNRTHTEGIDEEFMGIGLGYKMYKTCAKNLGFITSDDSATNSAKRVWSYLIRDSDFYTILTNNDVIVIDKNQTKDKIEKICNYFLGTHIDTPKKITKSWIKKFYDKEEDNIVYIDPELCYLFKSKNLNYLNWNFIKRYKKIKKHIVKSKYKDINSKYRKAYLKQKCFYIDDDSNCYEGKIVSINHNGHQIVYEVEYTEGSVVTTRSAIIVCNDVEEKYKLDIKFNLPIYKKVTKDCYVTDYCDYVEAKKGIRFGLRNYSFEDKGYTFSTKEKIKSIDDFKKSESYIIETEKGLFVADILNISKDKTKLYIMKYGTELFNEYVGDNKFNITYYPNNTKKYITFNSIINVYKIKKES